MMDRIVVAVAIGMGLVFGTGIMVGIVTVIAMSARRADKADRGRRHSAVPAADPGHVDDGEPAEEPSWRPSRDDD